MSSVTATDLVLLFLTIFFAAIAGVVVGRAIVSKRCLISPPEYHELLRAASEEDRLRSDNHSLRASNESLAERVRFFEANFAKLNETVEVICGRDRKKAV